MKTGSEQLTAEFLRSEIVGINTLLDTPYGQRLLPRKSSHMATAVRIRYAGYTEIAEITAELPRCQLVPQLMSLFQEKGE